MQTDSKFYNLLGLARRAGKIGWGHDAACDAIKYGKAHLCILTSDASERLKNEFRLPLDIKYNASFNYGYRHGYEYFVRGLGNAYSFSTDKEAYWYDNLTNCNRTESNTGSYTCLGME